MHVFSNRDGAGWMVQLDSSRKTFLEKELAEAEGVTALVSLLLLWYP